ncbi:synthetase [Aureococcus anophagefferens]|nr:synthetase [Aureococcus anophagefferens]
MVKCSGKCFAAALLGSAQAFHVPRAAHTTPLVRPAEATAIADYLPDVPAEFMAQASITADEVAARYEKSVSDPGAFWAEEASRYHWETPFDASNVFSANFKRSEGEIAKWFDGGTTNLCQRARPPGRRGPRDKVCFIAERNDEGEAAPQPATYTYGEALDRAAKESEIPNFKGSYLGRFPLALEEVTMLAAALRARGVGKGDRVILFMPMVPELALAMLACARIGAVHTVVFGGFSKDSLAARISSSGAKAVVAADGVRRGKKVVDLWSIVVGAGDRRGRRPGSRAARSSSGGWTTPRTRARAGGEPGLVARRPRRRGPGTGVEWMAAEDPLSSSTSGSTGAPKGIVHTTGGYMVGAGFSFRSVFDAPVRDDDVWFCTADCGWITGHTYVAYGPLLNGATQVIFEGVPSWPDAGRLWRVVDDHEVTHVYTAPTAIRALMRSGDDPVEATSRKSLKVLGSVGEPINPEAWKWYREVVGEDRCPIADTWWQTETGAIMIAPSLPGAAPHKPGAAQTPCAGVVPTYFSYDGYYLTGDGARRDADGAFWITGRVDDVVVVSGHNIGTAEVESALVAHPAVAEAAIVGIPNDLKGNSLYAFVTLTEAGEADAGDDLVTELKLRAKSDVAAFAAPDAIHWAPGLPKTRSGKIMRRILRKIAADGVEVDREGLGDTSTLADPSIVDDPTRALPPPPALPVTTREPSGEKAQQ